MLLVLDKILDFFTSTTVGQYWCYLWIGVGVLIAFLIIFDNLKK